MRNSLSDGVLIATEFDRLGRNSLLLSPPVQDLSGHPGIPNIRTRLQSDKLNIGFEFTYADFGSAKIDSDTLVGEFETNRIIMFGVNFNWKRGI